MIQKQSMRNSYQRSLDKTRLSFVIRQYIQLRASNLSSQQAYLKLQESCPKEFHSSIDQIQTWLDLDQKNHEANKKGFFSFFDNISAQLSFGGIKLSNEKILLDSFDTIEETGSGFREGISDLTGYAIAVLAVSVITLIIFLHSVIPTFDEVFFNQNMQLPAFTQFIVEASNDFLLPFFALIFLAVIFLSYCYARLNQAIVEAKPLPAFLFVLPALKDLAALIEFRRVLVVVKLLDSDQEAESVGLVERVMDLILPNRVIKQVVSSHDYVLRLKAAEAMGQLPSELRFLENNKAVFVDPIRRFKKTIAAVSYALATVVAGALLIAMYLPIFQLGGN